MNDESAYRQQFVSGEVVFSEGERGDCAYIIDRGEVFVTCRHKGRVLHLATLGPGEIFGEMALIDDQPRTATITARFDTECLVIRRAQIQHRLKEADPITGTLLRLLLDRFRSMQNAIRERSDRPRPLQASAPATLSDEFTLQYTEARERLKLEQEIDYGIGARQFYFDYQPIVALDNSAIVGFEALVRWNHPERGRLLPGEFLGVADVAGMVAALDRTYFPDAMRFLADLPQDPPRWVSINLSPRRFGEPRLVEELFGAVSATGVDPQRVQIEILESALIENAQIAGTILNRIKDLGFTIAVDDFGTGYSSLSYLHRYPIDKLKIDRSFVQGIGAEGGLLSIVRAIAGLSQNLHIETVAEGIETEEQRVILQDLGVKYGQGWLFGRPAPADHWISPV